MKSGSRFFQGEVVGAFDYQSAYEAQRASSAEIQQLYCRSEEHVNQLLMNNDEALQLGKTKLSLGEAWQGLKWKAQTPVKYINVDESVILPGSYRKTHFGEQFTRVSIQPSFATGKPVIVQEDIYIDERSHAIYFFGRSVDVNAARMHLRKFHNDYLAEKPALFHVRHAVGGEEHDPVVQWEMIRLSEKPVHDSSEAQTRELISQLIHKSNGLKIYLQTIRQLTHEQLMQKMIKIVAEHIETFKPFLTEFEQGVHETAHYNRAVRRLCTCNHPKVVQILKEVITNRVALGISFDETNQENKSAYDYAQAKNPAAYDLMMTVKMRALMREAKEIFPGEPSMVMYWKGLLMHPNQPDSVCSKQLGK